MDVASRDLEDQARAALAAGDGSNAAALAAEAIRAAIAENPEMTPGGRVDRRIAQFRATVMAPALDALGRSSEAAEQRRLAQSVLIGATHEAPPAIAPVPVTTMAPAAPSATTMAPAAPSATEIDLTGGEPRVVDLTNTPRADHDFDFPEFAAPPPPPIAPAPPVAINSAAAPAGATDEPAAPLFDDAALQRLADTGLARLQQFRDLALHHGALADVGRVQQRITTALIKRGQTKDALAQLELLEEQYPHLATAPEMSPAWATIVDHVHQLGTDPEHRIALAQKLAVRNRSELATHAWGLALSPQLAEAHQAGLRAATAEPMDHPHIAEGLAHLEAHRQFRTLAQYFQGYEHENRDRGRHAEADRAAAKMVEAIEVGINDKQAAAARGELGGIEPSTHSKTVRALVAMSARVADPELAHHMMERAIELNALDPEHSYHVAARLHDAARQVWDEQPQRAAVYLGHALTLQAHAPDQAFLAREQLEALGAEHGIDVAPILQAGQGRHGHPVRQRHEASSAHTL